MPFLRTTEMADNATASSTGEVAVPIRCQLNNSSSKKAPTVFEPQLADDGLLSSPQPNPSISEQPGGAPEKKLTLLALRLAVLEKAATRLGSLAFLWATLVLQAGFAMALHTVDFWFVTTILVIEGARIFSRSHELEWQHRSTGSSFHLKSLLRWGSTTEAKKTFSSSSETKQKQQQNGVVNVSHPLRRTWASSEVSFLPYGGRVLKSSSVSLMLFWLQVVSACTCVSLSVTRLWQQSYGKADTDTRNRQAALNIFYSLALAESLLFLVQKIYCGLQLDRLLRSVSETYELNQSEVPIQRFFFDAFSKCIQGSVFDGLKMDLVSFSEELLASDFEGEQRIGASFLYKLAGKKDHDVSKDTLRKIGSSTATMQRLMEMLNWKSPSEEDLRFYAAEVVSSLASKKQNVLRVAAIPGSIESIASLITRQVDCNDVVYDLMKFRLSGLLILKRLANNHDNCSRISNTRNLLPKVIQFTAVKEWLTCPASSNKNCVKAAKRSLKLLQMLANASGATGKLMRREIASIVFTVGNMRDILRHGGGEHKLLQRLAVEVLTSLTLEPDARSRIGATGGVIPELFNVFFAFKGGDNYDVQQYDVSNEAGNALAMLALHNRDNCRRMLELHDVDRLAMTLHKTDQLRVSTSRILTNLCIYGDSKSMLLLRGVANAAPTVFQVVMKEKKKKNLEVSIGLAVQIFRLLSQEKIEQAYRKISITETELVCRIIQILQSYTELSHEEPRMRMYAIELMISMMKPAGMTAEHIVKAFKAEGVEEHLKKIADTTSDWELYDVFSGSTGLSRRKTTIESLVKTAMCLLSRDRAD